MTNPVNNGSRINNGLPVTTNSKSVRADKSVESTNTSQAAVVGADASTESSRLQQLRERINTTPDVDMARVEEIKQALAEGRLTFDPQRIAEKFADLEGLLDR